MPLRSRVFRAASMPEATAAVFSKATCIDGTFQALCGKGEVTISMQPVALATMTLEPAALVTMPMAMISTQPWQARWPEEIWQFSGAAGMFLAVILS